ncbi:MAG: pseudouridine synthase [Lysobacteraceae bacterium]
MTSTPSDSATRRTLSLKRDAATPAAATEERLHKVLAQAGLGSRRALEERIAQGQVLVNGAVAITGSSVRAGDRIELDGRTFVAATQTDPARVLVYHKPEGEVTTREDPEGRPTVFDRLPQIKGARWIGVGRLDINTTGLLLLTTDGELANALMHPSGQVVREYICRIHGEVSDETMEKLARGVELEDGPARFDEIERIGASDSHAWFRVVLHEGRNREVRRMWEALGLTVSRLKRVRYGSVELPRLLRRGHSEELSPEAVAQLRKAAGLPDAPAEAVLTLEPVIGQRRARPSEYRPAPREQRAWTQGAYGDEGRELRAFDNLREDRPARAGKPRFGKGKKPADGNFNKAGKNRSFAAGRAVPDDIGNRLTAPGGAAKSRGKGGRRGAAPGFENPTEHRSWYVPEGVTTGSRVAPPRGQNAGKPFGKPTGKPSGKPGEKPFGRGARPGGDRPAGDRPGGRFAGPGGGGNHPGGNRNAPRGGNRPGHGGPRSNKPR